MLFNNFLIYSLFYLPVNRVSPHKQGPHCCLVNSPTFCTDDAALWREYFHTDTSCERHLVTKTKQMIAGTALINKPTLRTQLPIYDM